MLSNHQGHVGLRLGPNARYRDSLRLWGLGIYWMPSSLACVLSPFVESLVGAVGSILVAIVMLGAAVVGLGIVLPLWVASQVALIVAGPLGLVSLDEPK